MKVITILIFVLTLLSFNNQSIAETKDCSQYNTNTFFGTLDKRRCEKGLPVKERENLVTMAKKLWPFKKK